MQDVILSPTDFVALVNQTLEYAYPILTLEGELTNFRVAKNRWLYFDLKDDVSSVSCFGTVYQLPGPLEDGMKLRVTGSPRLHQRFGFSVNIQSISPAGEGSIKKAADLLRAKLLAEGLFDPARKRSLPTYASKIGLITAAASAAYADVIKILKERWGGAEIYFQDAGVQGESAPVQLVAAIEYINQLPTPPEILIITRGGGSAEDLAVFNDERVVRAVAGSRISTLVAIGHEVDESLAELAADVRASTPTNAAQLAVPDKTHEQVKLKTARDSLDTDLAELQRQIVADMIQKREHLTSQVIRLFEIEKDRLEANRRVAGLFDPAAALKRGYAYVRNQGKLIKSVKGLKVGDRLLIELADGKIDVSAKEIING